MGIDTYTQAIIENRIFAIRGIQVMLDRDLAEIYGVETRVLNQAVKRNIERFPAYFRFQLTQDEFADCSRSQFVILNNESKAPTIKRGENIKYLPYAFTEQGVAMLSAVLRSETAVKVSIQIMNAFVEMRKVLISNAGLLQRVESIESKLQINDKNFERIFTALEQSKADVKQDIFFDGQIFDAYLFVVNLIKKAKSDIIIIDNYIDQSILEMLTQKTPKVKVSIITQENTPIKTLDIQKFNAQYETLEVKHSKKFHDRFLIIDQNELYHIGASLKDLGKKCFAFSVMENKQLLHNLIASI